MATVLVIEDEEGILTLIKRIVTRLGHEAITAMDGETALARAGSGAYQLILTDFTLPHGSGGLPLVASLQALQPQCPIVVTTGLADPERLEQLRGQGIQHILGKPFDVLQLQTLLKQLLPPAS